MKRCNFAFVAKQDSLFSLTIDDPVLCIVHANKTRSMQRTTTRFRKPKRLKQGDVIEAYFSVRRAHFSSSTSSKATCWYNCEQGCLVRSSICPKGHDAKVFDHESSEIHMVVTSKELIFCARGLSRVYRVGGMDVWALKNVNLDLFAGEFVVFLGPSGSGKSTLLNILGGLDVPTAGQVRFRDHDLSHDDDAVLTHYRRQHVGFVFQFYNLIPSLTALENVAIVTDIAEHPMPPAEALKLVGLDDRMNHYPAQLRGGRATASSHRSRHCQTTRRIAVRRTYWGSGCENGYRCFGSHSTYQ